MSSGPQFCSAAPESRSVLSVARPARSSMVAYSLGWDRYVFHPELVAITQDGGAGQREHEAVGQLDPPPITVEHRRQPAADAAIVELHVLVGAERVEHLLALFRREPPEIELVVTAEEVDPLRAVRAAAMAASIAVLPEPTTATRRPSGTGVSWLGKSRATMRLQRVSNSFADRGNSSARATSRGRSPTKGFSSGGTSTFTVWSERVGDTVAMPMPSASAEHAAFAEDMPHAPTLATQV